MGSGRAPSARGVGLFKGVAPRRTHQVAVAADHVLHVAEYGVETGKPVLYLHGGPGGGTPPDAPRLFDPEVYRAIVFDQRGCGLSTCPDRLRNNTTDGLIADIEAVRTTLGIERWGVMGSSYGSLLTALYAARHGSRVQWALLHGVFLGSRAEVAWLFEDGGASSFYPSQWAEFSGSAAAQLAPSRGGVAGSSSGLDDGADDAARTATRAAAAPPRLVAQYHRALVGHGLSRAHPPLPSAAAALPPGHPVLVAAAALAAWEDEMETLAPAPAEHEPAELVANAQIAIHYFFHGCFLPDEGALPELRAAASAEGAQGAEGAEGGPRLGAIPCAIVQGRHDVICPPHTAAALHAAWSGSQLRLVESGAHALFERPMRLAAQAAIAELAAAVDAVDVDGSARRPAKRQK